MTITLTTADFSSVF